eukprot:g12287.t1 g12287   contig6:1630659-1631297(+)
MSEDNSSSSPESKESEEDFNQPEIKNVVDEPDLSATESAEEAESKGLSLKDLGSEALMAGHCTTPFIYTHGSVPPAKQRYHPLQQSPHSGGTSNRYNLLRVQCFYSVVVHFNEIDTIIITQVSARCTTTPFANRPHKQMSPTLLHNGIIIDVDDNFFTAAFFSIGLFYSLGKAYNRYLLEEVAFEQRKLEARERRLEEDPTLSELEFTTGRE